MVNPLKPTLSSDPGNRQDLQPPFVYAGFNQFTEHSIGARRIPSAHGYVPLATTGISTVSLGVWGKSNCSRRIEAAGTPAT
jgi:hypothetical protein